MEDDISADTKAALKEKKRKEKRKINIISAKKRKRKVPLSDIAKWAPSIIKKKYDDGQSIKALIQEKFGQTPNDDVLKILTLIGKSRVVNKKIVISDTLANTELNFYCVYGNQNMNTFSNDKLYLNSLFAIWILECEKKFPKSAPALFSKACILQKAVFLSSAFKGKGYVRRGYYQDFAKDYASIGFEHYTKDDEKIKAIQEMKKMINFTCDNLDFQLAGNPLNCCVIGPTDESEENFFAACRDNTLGTKILNMAKGGSIGFKELNKQESVYFLNSQVNVEDFCPCFLVCEQVIKTSIVFKAKLDYTGVFAIMEKSLEENSEKVLYPPDALYWNTMPSWIDFLTIFVLTGRGIGPKLKESIQGFIDIYRDIKDILALWKKIQMNFQNIIKEFYESFQTYIQYDKLDALLKKVKTYIEERDNLLRIPINGRVMEFINHPVAQESGPMMCRQFLGDVLQIADAIKTILDEFILGRKPENKINDLRRLGLMIYNISLTGNVNYRCFPIVISPAGFLGTVTGDLKYGKEDNILEAIIKDFSKARKKKKEGVSELAKMYVEVATNMNLYVGIVIKKSVENLVKKLGAKLKKDELDDLIDSQTDEIKKNRVLYDELVNLICSQTAEDKSPLSVIFQPESMIESVKILMKEKDLAKETKKLKRKVEKVREEKKKLEDDKVKKEKKIEKKEEKNMEMEESDEEEIKEKKRKRGRTKKSDSDEEEEEDDEDEEEEEEEEVETPIPKNINRMSRKERSEYEAKLFEQYKKEAEERRKKKQEQEDINMKIENQENINQSQQIQPNPNPQIPINQSNLAVSQSNLGQTQLNLLNQSQNINQPPNLGQSQNIFQSQLIPNIQTNQNIASIIPQINTNQNRQPEYSFHGGENQNAPGGESPFVTATAQNQGLNFINQNPNLQAQNKEEDYFNNIPKKMSKDEKRKQKLAQLNNENYLENLHKTYVEQGMEPYSNMSFEQFKAYVKEKPDEFISEDEEEEEQKDTTGGKGSVVANPPRRGKYKKIRVSKIDKNKLSRKIDNDLKKIENELNEEKKHKYSESLIVPDDFNIDARVVSNNEEAKEKLGELYKLVSEAYLFGEKHPSFKEKIKLADKKKEELLKHFRDPFPVEFYYYAGKRIGSIIRVFGVESANKNRQLIINNLFDKYDERNIPENYGDMDTTDLYMSNLKDDIDDILFKYANLKDPLQNKKIKNKIQEILRIDPQRIKDLGLEDVMKKLIDELFPPEEPKKSIKVNLKNKPEVTNKNDLLYDMYMNNNLKGDPDKGVKVKNYILNSIQATKLYRYLLNLLDWIIENKLYVFRKRPKFGNAFTAIKFYNESFPLTNVVFGMIKSKIPKGQKFYTLDEAVEFIANDKTSKIGPLVSFKNLKLTAKEKDDIKEILNNFMVVSKGANQILDTYYEKDDD